MVCESSVKNTIEEICNNSPILKEVEEKGEVKGAGVIYDMDTGNEDWLQ